MAIRFRCEHCHQLMSIASRQAGQMVPCPGCARNVMVPIDIDTPASTPQEPLPVPETTRPPEREAASPPVDAKKSEGPSASERPRREESPQTTTRETAPGPRISVAAERESDEDGGFRLRSVKSDFGEMDLTPMVDVTFLLLIFFMVTASFSLQKSIEVPRPDPDQEGATQSIQTPEDLQENSVIVRIDENDAITIDYEPVTNPDNLAVLLLDKRRIEQKGDLVIAADERATHGTVVLVNDAAVEADFQHIRLAVGGGAMK